MYKAWSERGGGDEHASGSYYWLIVWIELANRGTVHASGVLLRSKVGLCV
jgi:hypothetical protein